MLPSRCGAPALVRPVHRCAGPRGRASRRAAGPSKDVLGRPIKERRFELEAALRLRDGVHLAVRPDDDTS